MSEFLHIITDPAHVLAEMFFIAVEGVLISPIVAFLVRRHDRRKHPKVAPPKAVLPLGPPSFMGVEMVVDPLVPPNTAYLLDSRMMVGPETRKALITDLSSS